jgi:1,4-alpha-glucan branching enzyme
MSKRSHTPPTPRPSAPTALTQKPPEPPPPSPLGFVLSDQDLYLFNEGSHFRLYDKLGAHPVVENGAVTGTSFAVWAPNAREVFVMGEFNGWNKTSHPLHSRGQSGIWQNVVPGVGPGTVYKFHIVSHHNNYRVDKADPVAFYNEVPPRTGSVVWQLDYDWKDADWMANRARSNGLQSPINIYEVHLGSWQRVPEEGNRSLGYREIAKPLADHVRRMNYTHVEFLPIMEHPFYGSWGYQATGFFAPTARYGSPQDFMYLVDYLHQQGIGVILDWVPSHFPTDEHGLIYFDGTHLYEHSDPRMGLHREWGSAVFNYGRNEVRSFLISSAMYWLDKYHVDGLRVDAVASMLYLDYNRKEGEWIPNKYGGKENIDAIDFLRRMNAEIYGRFPDVQTIAEESTSWAMVSRPTYIGGLGFGLKWDMGWMHDTLAYFELDPVHRKFHHTYLTFRQLYAWTENFVLSLSHDEVVYGKRSLLNKLPGDYWQKFANLRLLLGYMIGQNGKKLVFMGGEFGQWNEWNHETSLDWHLLHEPGNGGLVRWVEDVNKLYRTESALYELDFDPAGFQWVDANDSEQSVISFLRRGKDPDTWLLFVLNFTPVPRWNYRVGVPLKGLWKEILNSDSREYGGSGQGNFGGVETAPIRYHGRPVSLNVTVPPLGMVVFKNAPARQEV